MPARYVVVNDGKLVIERWVGRVRHAEFVEHERQKLQEIQQERDEAIVELRKEFADLAIAAAEKVIEQELDKETHRKLIDKVLDEADSLKQS